ncbi:MAG: FHA domain-containing protein [Bacteriovorax sp.]|jgi:pSer/pThr/pTyr-binding forkhead associated (FHA) protein
MNKSANVRITSELKNPAEAGTHYRLLCMTGPNKGRVYYLTGKRIIIGRGETADIQIVDVKISREHAELSFADNGYTITDLGAQNGIIVNDNKVKQKKLSDAEKVVIGQTVFKYNIIEVSNSELIISSDDLAASSSKDSPKGAKQKAQNKSSALNNIDAFASKRASAPEKKSGSKGIVIVIILAVVGYVLFFDAEEPVKPSKSKSGKNDFENDFNATPVVRKDAQEDPESKRKLENYIHSGRREFGEGNYFRAMEDFRLALLLSPNNGHASFYLSKAKQSLDDDIRKNFEKGKQEYESKKLQAAIVSYCGVVQLIQNYPDDERYKNAMLQISAIESQLGLEKGEVKCFEAKSADSKN